MGKNKLKVVDEATQPTRPSIVITNEFLGNKTTFMAMQDLLKGRYDSVTAYALDKLGRRLNQAQKVLAKKQEAIIKKYSKLDEHGVPIRKMEPKILSNGQVELRPVKVAPGEPAAVDANGKPLMEPVLIPVDFDWRDVVEKNEQGEEITTPGNQLAEIEFSNLAEEKITLDVYKLSRMDFMNAQLTVAQWASLNPFWTDPFEDEEADELEE